MNKPYMVATRPIEDWDENGEAVTIVFAPNKETAAAAVALSWAEKGDVSSPADLAGMVLSAYLVTDDINKITQAVGGPGGLETYVFNSDGEPVVLGAEEHDTHNALIDIALRQLEEA